MARKNREQEDEYSQPPVGIESMLQSYYAFLQNTEKPKLIKYGIAWGAIALVLIVVASIPLPEGLTWISGVAGAPAGVILFLGVLALIQLTSLKDTSMAQIRTEKSPRQRMPVALGIVFAAVVLLLLIAASIPFGVGGVTIVIAALSAFNIARRTPQELEWAKQGIPDPREFIIDEDDQETEYYDDEDDEDQAPRGRMRRR